MKFKVEVKGFKELDEELKNLPLKLQKKAFQDAAKSGAKVIMEEARKKIPVRVKEWEGANYGRPPGTLKRKGLSIKKAKTIIKGTILYNVFTNKKYGWYGLWVERGHFRVIKKGIKERFQYKNKITGKTRSRAGKIIGWVSAKPFMRPALQSGLKNAQEAMKNIIKKYIDEYKPDYAFRK